jgi:large subunit ribosomal protein L31
VNRACEAGPSALAAGKGSVTLRAHFSKQATVMKPEIHPEYHIVKATCSCGNVMEIGSTLRDDIHLDVCSSCHPFYTGKQKTIDSGGRVEKFRQRFAKRTSSGS